MSSMLKCTMCGAQMTLSSRQVAVEAGWKFIEIATRDRTKYHCLCPAEKPAWLKAALEEKP